MKSKVLIKDYEILSQSLISLQSQVTNTEERLVWEGSSLMFRDRILLELRFWGIGVIPNKHLQRISNFHPDEKLPDDSISLIFNSLRKIKKIRLSGLGLSNDWILEWLDSVECLSLSDNSIDGFQLSRLSNLKVLFIVNTKIANLSILAGLNSLEEIYCALNPLKELEAIMMHRNLKVLNCRSCDLSRAQMRDFKKANPICKVYWRSWLWF